MSVRRSVTDLAVGVTRMIPYARTVLMRLGIYERTAANITRMNTRRAYDRVYGSDRLLGEYLDPERIAFYEELATFFAPSEPRRLVDVGCGTGDLLRCVLERMATRPERVVGVDHSEAGIRRARELVPIAEWIVADIYNPILKGEQFDLVLCTEVLEHLDAPERAVRVLCRLCAPGGKVAITVPDGARDAWEGHVNYWDESALHVFLHPYGLDQIIRVDNGNTLLASLEPHQSS